jgi:hypothetical protein
LNPIYFAFFIRRFLIDKRIPGFCGSLFPTNRMGTEDGSDPTDMLATMLLIIRHETSSTHRSVTQPSTGKQPHRVGVENRPFQPERKEEKDGFRKTTSV